MSKKARTVKRRRHPSGRPLARKVFLLLEVVATLALFVAGLFLWQWQQSLAGELKWAQAVKAAVDAQAGAVESAPGKPAATAERSPGSGPPQWQLQRVRIPTLGLDYRLPPETVHSTPPDGRGADTATLFLLLPVELYGAEVCRLAQLEPGDSIFLYDADRRAFAYQVAGGAQVWQGAGPAGNTRVVVAGYPCGGNQEQVLVAATGAPLRLP